ncbi:calcium-binding protein [Aeromonas veronii]
MSNSNRVYHIPSASATSTGMSVELRVDVTGMPHSFLVIIGPDGIERGVGLAPAIEGEPQSSGKIYDDTSHPYDSSTGKINLTPNEYNRLADYVNNSIDNPPPYNLFYGSQCANWAVTGLGSIGIPGVYPNLVPDNILRDLLETIIWNPYTQWINLQQRDFFEKAKNWVWPRDPIILDLDGDGLETVGLAANVYFDHDGDGVLTKTGWAGKDDALLVWDRNANGTIDTGAELFGDFTPQPNGTLAPNGFAALAALDANGDGILDASDPAFAELRLWRDVSQDGVSQGGEFITLAEAGIVSLNLANTLKNQNLANGNQLSREGSFIRTDGSSGSMGEFKLATDTFNTKFAEQIEVPESLKTLPTMDGAGNVRELRQAAAQSSSVERVLTQFQNATTRTEQKALLDQLITSWADTSGMAKSLEARSAGKYRIQYEAFGNDRRSSNLDAIAFAAVSSGRVSSGETALMTDFGATYLSENYRTLIAEWSRKLHVLEAFNGQYFFNLPTQKSQTAGANWGLAIIPGSANNSSSGKGTIVSLPTLNVNFSQAQLGLLQQSYDNLKESIYASLVLQTRLKPYLDQMKLVIDDSGLRLDATPLNQTLMAKKFADPENYLADLLDLDRYANGLLYGSNWSGLSDFDHLIETLPETAGIKALLDEFKVRRLTSGDDTAYLTNSADIVLAGEGKDTLYGYTGNDSLFGQGGDDRIYGGNGDDLISGGAGNDLLYGESGTDTYAFGRGAGYDTIIDFAESGIRRDTVHFLELKPSDIRVVADLSENLIFTIVDTNETLTVPVGGYGWGQNGVGQYVFDDGTVWSHEDVLRATVAAATESDDMIHGSIAGDKMLGLAGDDTLIGHGGNDVIDGGSGNDVLIGATGWSWDWQSGKVERNTTPLVSANGNDTYLFGRGDGQDTVIDGDYTAGNRDTLRFKEGVAPADVKFIRSGNDLVLVIRGSSDQVTLKQYFDEVWNSANTPYLIESIAFADGTLLDLTDVQAALFAGSEEAETIVGSQAADVLTGLGGDDVLLGGAGRDILDGGAGNDVLRGGGIIGWGNQMYDGSGEGDTYRFGWGDGHDTILEHSWQQGETDRIEFKSSVLPADVRLEQVRTVIGGQISDDLKITIRDTGETLTVKNHFNESNRYAVEEIIFANGTKWDTEIIKSRCLLGDTGNDELRGFSERDDLIEGGAGNDKLSGLSGNDMLVGGAGDDVLEGGVGSDTYRFGLGGGQDVIKEGYTTGEDIVELAAGITPTDVTVRWTLQGDMAVMLPDGCKLTVRKQAVNGFNEWGVEQLRFADGTVWNCTDLAARALAATDGDDAIIGGYQDDTLDGGSGRDHFLDLGGDDTYRFGIGDGQDVITDNSGRVLFKPGISQNDVSFIRDGNDLIAIITATGDAVRVKDWLNSWQQIDYFDFDNGARLSVTDVLAKLNVSEAKEILFGSPNEDRLTGTEKDSTLYGRDGHDMLLGGAGSDRLFGEAGDDMLDGGADRDMLYGGEGHNSYRMVTGMGLDMAQGASLAVANDTVLFASGIRPVDVSVQLGEVSQSAQTGDIGYYNLVIGIGGNDALVINSGTGTDLARSAIQHFRFDDGTEWTLADLVSLADGGKMGQQQREYWDEPTTIVGSQADDYIHDYTGQSVTVQARGNNDIIHLEAGNDRVSAGSGYDIVYSGAGEDLVAGDAGNDELNTGAGDDVVVFNPGDGNDTLNTAEGIDTLSFGAMVTPSMLSVALDSNGRVVLLLDADAGCSITLDNTNINHLPGDLERIQFIDAAGKTRVFDLAGWLQAHARVLLSATTSAPLDFDGEGFELTGTVAPAGGLEAVAYAQNGDLFASAHVSNNTPSDGDDVLYGTPDGDLLDTGAGNDIALGLAGDDRISGGEGNDLLHGGAGDDVLEGNTGNDVVYGGWGADQLTGGTGNDQLFGEWGGDVYIYQHGHGEVIIDDEHRVYSVGDAGERPQLAARREGEDLKGDIIIDDAPNILAFGQGIRPEDLRYSERNGDLVIEFVNQPGDRVILKGYEPRRATQTRSVDIIRFADGTEVVAETFEPTGKTATIGDEGGVLQGTQFADTLIGGDGDDKLNGMAGADRLVGGVGSDTYLIHKERNARPTETVITETWREMDFNCIEITGDINAEDLRLEFDGHDLLLHLTEGGDVIRFAGFDPRAEGMRAPFSEVSLPWREVNLSFDDLLSRSVRIIGTRKDDVLIGTALAEWIEGRRGDNTMSGGAGGDFYIIDADAGNDTIIDSEKGDAPNTLVLPEGTRLDNVLLSYDIEGFLVIDLDNTGNCIRLSGFDPQNPLGARAVERFRFGIEGDEISYEELIAHGFDIFGYEESDTLKGTTLTDRIRGGDGNDLIEATPGGDRLMGEGGNDTYVVHLGDGIISIADVAEEEAGNVLRFGTGIDPNELRNNLRFEADGNGGYVLLIPYGNAGEMVRLSGFNPQDVLGRHAIERFEFADGTAVDYATLVSWTFVVEGDNAGNALAGTNVGDRVYGYDEDDVIVSGDGKDVLTGGLGNDVMRGGTQRDAYVVHLGDGRDVIEDDLDEGIGNVLTFGEGIARNDVRLEVDGDDLLIHYGSHGDVVRVNNYAPDGVGGATVIDSFEFTDGTAITLREFRNRAPEVVNPISAQIVMEDIALSLRLPDGLFIDADDDAILTQVTVSSYTTRPDWLQYDTTTRTLFGTPDNDDVGEFDVIVQGIDTLGATSMHSFHVTVLNTNDAPEVGSSLSDQCFQEDSAFSFTLPAGCFRDVDVGDELTYTATMEDGNPLPTWLMFDAKAGKFFGAPGNDNVGVVAIRVMATDRFGASANQSFNLNVMNTNDTPIIGAALPAQSATEDAVFTFVLPTDTFVDADPGDHLNYSATLADGSALPAWLQFDAANGIFSGTPDNINVGLVTIRVTATDLFGARVSQLFNLTVQNTNDAPEVAIALSDQQATEDVPFAFTVPLDAFRDMDVNDRLSYTAVLANGSSLPRWLAFDASTMRFSGVPNDTDVGRIEVKVIATDRSGAIASDVFSIVVNADTLPEPGLTLNGDWRDNRLIGGAGDDVAYGNGGSDYINLFGGNNRAYGSYGNDIILAGSGNDTLYGNGGNDLIDAGEGQNRITAGWGNDTITSGAGDDTIDADGGCNRISAGAGNDRITTLWGDDWIDAGSGNNVISAGVGNNSIVAGSGNDVITTGTGNDIIHAGDGDNVISASEGCNQIFTGDGQDVIRALGVNRIQSGGGNDDITLGWGADIIDAGAGDDVIRAGGGGDSVRGGAGNDLIFGNQWSNDTYVFRRHDGQDIISDNGGSDVLLFENVNLDDLLFRRVGNDLKINVIEQHNNSVTVQGWYSKSFGKIEQIRTSDGNVLFDSQVNARVLAAAANSKTSRSINKNVGRGAHAPFFEHEAGVNYSTGPSLGHHKEAVRDNVPLERFLDSFKRDNKTAESMLHVLKLDNRWLEPQQQSAQVDHVQNHNVEHRWAELTHALELLDAERQGVATWEQVNQGIDIPKIIGGMKNEGNSNSGGFSCTGVSDIQLRLFSGIKDGIDKLPW